jgi:hypothetical protein
MRRPTYTKLQSRVAELEQENASLSNKLDSILDIASDDEDEDDDGEEEDEETEE